MSAQPDVIVVGGGIAGASIAYQLTRRARRVLVLERSLLGSGSTGRAAGLLGQLRSSEAATSMMMESLRIVAELEERTGAELFVRTGSLRLATTEARATETRDHVAFGQQLGLDIELVDSRRLAELVPQMRVDDVLTASWCPSDGHLLPAELHDAFVRQARAGGAELRPNTPVAEVLVEGGRVTGVRTAAGERIGCDVVVNAAGPWSYVVAKHAGQTLQTCAIGHTYLTSTPDDRFPIDRSSPAVRDYDHRIYSRPEAGGLLVGMYEAEPEPYDMARLPADFDMTRMTVARDDLTLALLREATHHRFPFMAERVGFTVTHGIMTFTPNGSPVCGELPDAKGLFHCAGFCGHGIVQSPAVGALMADLIEGDAPRYDLEQLRADRYHDVPALQDRSTIQAAGHRSYAGHYGKRDPSLN